jgi:hypothetical protein
MSKQILVKHDIENLYYHPTMIKVLDAIKDITFSEAEHITRTLNTNRSCEEIALQVAEFKGRQKILNTIIDSDLLISLLSDYIIEEEVDKNGQSNRGTNKN